MGKQTVAPASSNGIAQGPVAPGSNDDIAPLDAETALPPRSKFRELARAAEQSFLYVAIGVGVAVVGLAVGEVEGQILVGFAGILISSSTAANLAVYEREKEFRRRQQEQQERQQALLESIGRQLLNVHRQLRRNATENDAAVSRALVNQSRENLFFVVNAISKELPGRLDIQAAETQEILDEVDEVFSEAAESFEGSAGTYTGQDVSEFLRDLREQARASIAPSSADTSPKSPRPSLAVEVGQRIPPPSVDADLIEWRDWARRTIQSLSDRRRDGSVDPSTVGQILRDAEVSHPVDAGPQLQNFLQYALTGTHWCITSSTDGGFARIFPRHGVPDGFRVLPGLQPSNGNRRLVDAGEDFHTPEAYARLLREGKPSVRFPASGLMDVCAEILRQQPADAPGDQVFDLLKDALDVDDPEIRQSLWLLVNLGVLASSPQTGPMNERMLSLGPQHASVADMATAIIAGAHSTLHSRIDRFGEVEFLAVLPPDLAVFSDDDAVARRVSTARRT